MNTIIRNRMVKTLLICIIFFTSSTAVMAQQLNFSGVWKLDKEKTDFGELSENSTPIQLIIDQQKDYLSIERFSKNSQNETHSYLEKLSFKGQTAQTMILSTMKTAFIKWTDDKKSLVESSEYKDANAPDDFKDYKATETWALSVDGKTLTVARVDEFNSGQQSRKIIYQRQ